MLNFQHRPLVSYDTPVDPDSRIYMCGLPGSYISDDGSLELSECLLHQELTRLKRSNVDVLVGLVEDDELGCFAYEDICDEAARVGLAVERLEIVDFGAPSERRDSDWCALRSEIAVSLKRGRSVAFHCMAGIGRSGMMASSLLVYLGMTPSSACRRVRSGEPCALESEEQHSYLLRCH